MKSLGLFYPLVIIAFFITIGELGNATVYGSVDVEPDWTTYENSQYDISFDYPEGYDLIGGEGARSLLVLSIVSFDSDPDYGGFILTVNLNNMTLREFIDKDLANEGGIGERILFGDINPITISDDFSGLSYNFNSKTSNSESINRAVVFNTDEYIFRLSHQDSVGPNSGIFDHMIESIKVTDNQ
jgi:hypothetical protein